MDLRLEARDHGAREEFGDGDAAEAVEAVGDGAEACFAETVLSALEVVTLEWWSNTNAEPLT